MAAEASWTQRLPGGIGAPGGLVAVALLAASLVLGLVTSGRVGVFRSEQAMLREGARNYPRGIAANLLALSRAGPSGDAAAATQAVRNLEAFGFASYNALVNDPSLAPVNRDPAYRAAIRDLTGYWVERLQPIEEPYQIELQQLAYAHFVRDELEQSAEVAGRGLELGGPHDADLRAIRDAALAGLGRREARQP